MDEAGAINTMVWAGPKYLSDSAAAVWIFWPPASIDALRSAAREDGGDYHGDPIFTQTLSITEQFIQSVMKKADSKDAPIILHQNPGDTVVVPAGFAHQLAAELRSLSRDVNHLRQELRRAEGAVTIAAVKREVSSAFLRASELVSQTGRQLGV
ncbi:hypothetical protein OC842_007214 [Tilletia horrida]|uniref:JmjC domain-containing protein n=1 Tax=Tilletia horrida TaxID=155126 RepID=A0AAN6G4C2_9BASI|nr:hypothetical protein OC842_007214 [Tilletia horrida]